MKRCTVCKIEKELSSFSKYARSKDGLKSYCKSCASEQNRKRREKKRDEINAKNRAWYAKSKEKKEERTKKALSKKEKRCSYCNEIKPTTEFYERGNGGLYGECKECHNKKVKIYVEENREKVLRRKRLYNLKTRETRLEYLKNYSRENSKRNVERAKTWANNNREKVRVYGVMAYHRRRAKMKNLKNSFTRGDWEFCKEFFKNEKGFVECAYCSKEMKNATQDYFIPIHSGGHHIATNILPVCLNCNSKKSAQEFNEWYKHTPFYNQKNINRIEEYFDILKSKQRQS
ncbi:TPA: HNH endonuclease [Staphylococcus delphini]|nr:HNH endonuclease [Staphylococcus delphini]HEC2216141.1 HNH endonuclease [Staphylococcus delphini]HEC2231564.1 HNH endonuclease [Staphylococcus delphini]